METWDHDRGGRALCRGFRRSCAAQDLRYIDPLLSVVMCLMLHIVMTADCLWAFVVCSCVFYSVVGPGIMNVGTATIIMHPLRVEFLLIHSLVIRF